MAEQGRWFLSLVIMTLVLGNEIFKQIHVVSPLICSAVSWICNLSGDILTHSPIILGLVIIIREVSTEFPMRLVMVFTLCGLLSSLINN